MLLRAGFGALRTTYEAFVVFELLNGVVQRWSERISVGSLTKVVLDPAICREIDENVGRLSRYIEGHLHSDAFSAVKPTPALLFEEIGIFETLRKRHRQSLKPLALVTDTAKTG